MNRKRTCCALVCLALLLSGIGAALSEGFNATGFPIVDEPVTLTAIVSASSNMIGWDQMPFFTKLAALTNVKLDAEIVTQAVTERFTLMFASNDLPDLIFNGPTQQQANGAIEAGQIIALDDMLEAYAPNWTAYLDSPDYAYVRKAVVHTDGRIYALPYLNFGYQTRIRDIWTVSGSWLAELGFDMPKTTDDLYAFLKAVKDHAGTGTIPENVIPLYLLWNPYANGGCWEIFNAFGAYSGPNYMGVDAQTQQVYLSAVMPEMLAAIQYLHTLYAQGLIAPEMFTDDSAARLARISTYPITVGSYLYVRNLDESEAYFTALPPLTSPTNDTPMYRPQNNQVTTLKFMISSNCPHPEAAIRLMDTIADPYWAMQQRYGMVGTEAITDNGDGSYSANTWGADFILYEWAPENVIAGIVSTPWEDEHLIQSYTATLKMRYIDEVYADALMPVESLYPTTIVWDEAKLNRANEIGVDLLDYINTSFANAIVNGITEAEFEAFVTRCESIGLAEYLALYQEQLDSYNRR